MDAASPEVIWSAGEERRARARVTAFMAWLREEGRADLPDRAALHAWSVRDLEGFWGAVWDHFDVLSDTPRGPALAADTMPGAVWFPGVAVSYPEHCLRDLPGVTDASLALDAFSQTRDRLTVTRGDLREQVRRCAAGLRRLGVGRGDRVVAYLPNIPEAFVACLAATSLGAVWASCAPEFGATSVIDRFAQVEPTVLLAVTGYTYGDKPVDKSADLDAVRAGLPSLRHLVHVPYGAAPAPDGAIAWGDLLADTDEPLTFERVPFDHPLYVLFSSGTTGVPKAIIHSHGGILLEHLKSHAFHWDLHPGDRLMWFSTTAWMMWNTLVSALLVGAGAVIIDGNPLYPDASTQWRIAEQSRATFMGCAPGYLMQTRAAGSHPAQELDLSALHTLSVSGSPLSVEGFRWVTDELGDAVQLMVVSGGTDLCGGILDTSPLLPTYAGEMSGAHLACAAAAYDDDGRPVVGELGELVITRPMPSMPVGFWGDTDGSRMHASYFERYPGVWCHGDWVRFSPAGTAVITGRSDATLNRGGVRLGSAEFYRVLAELPEVADALVVHLEDPAGGMGELICFVQPAAGVSAGPDLDATIARALRSALSPRHVPDRVVVVGAIPYNRTGKKLEIPVKRILQGADPAAVAQRGALADPDALEPYVAYARERTT